MNAEKRSLLDAAAQTMSRSLVELAYNLGAGSNRSAKPATFYAVYDPYLAELAEGAITFLELGVHAGISLKVWASFFVNGRIIGIDLAKTAPDLSRYSNIVYESADQTDRSRLEAICRLHAPDGFDVILDDASHIGLNSALSYEILFPHLKPGGLYIIEDWGTGYYDDWPDGGHYQKIRVEPFDGLVPKRIPSHDFGMVGFVKSLVDEVGGDHIKPTFRSNTLRVDTVEFLHIHKTCVIIKKV